MEPRFFCREEYEPAALRDAHLPNAERARLIKLPIRVHNGTAGVCRSHTHPRGGKEKKKEMKSWDRMREKGGGEGEEGFPCSAPPPARGSVKQTEGKESDGWQPSGRWKGALGVNVERRPHRELAACWC